MILKVVIAALGGLLLVAALLWFGIGRLAPVVALTPGEYAAREAVAQATSTAVANQVADNTNRDHVVQPVITLVEVLALLVIGGLVVALPAGAAHHYWQRRRPLVIVAGELVSRQAVERGGYDRLIYGVVAARGQAAIEAARRPMIDKLNYTVTVRDGDRLALPQPSDESAAAQEAAPRLQLAQVLAQLPHNGLLIPFGSDERGQLVARPLEEAVHILLAGGSGAGKSYLAQAGVSGLLAANDEDIFKLACFDVEGQTSQPFRPYAWMYADEGPGILAGMEELCAEIDRRQLAGKNDLDWQPLDNGYPYILAMVEEAASLIDEIKMMGKPEYIRYVMALKKVAVRGRKWGVDLLQLKQIDYSEPDFRLAQGQFATRLLGYCKPTAGRAMGFMNTDALNDLWRAKERGRFYMEDAEGDRLLWSPLLDRRQLPALLARYRRSTSVQDDSADLNAGLNVQAGVIDAQSWNVPNVQDEQQSQAQEYTQAMNVQAFNLTAEQQSKIIALARAGVARGKICDVVLGGRGRYNEVRIFLDHQEAQQ